MSWRRIVVLVGVAAAGVAMVGVGVFLARQGLQKADAWSAVLSLFVGVVTLAVTVWLGLRQPNAGDGRQSIRGVTAGRDINQVGRVSGSYSTGDGAARPTAARGRSSGASSEQSTQNSSAGRDINQVEGVDGDFRSGRG